MPDLSTLPLPIAMLVAFLWFYLQISAANDKRMAMMIDAFDRQYQALVKDYQAVVQLAYEDRQEARQRWVERDRLMSERLDRSTVELTQNKAEIHALRNAIQAIATTVELIARETLPGRTTRRGGSKLPESPHND